MPGTERMPWCDFCRVNDAIGWFVDERGRREEPVCAECFEALIEREQAIAIADAAGDGGGARLREMLPPLRIAAPRPMRRPVAPLTADELAEGERKAEQLRDEWQAFVEEAERRGRELDESGDA